MVSSKMVVGRLLLLLIAVIALATCEDGPAMPSPYDTIVVGLGSSGVTAAATLARAGRRVLALDGQDHIGGRVYTRPFADGIVEVGAEWIHGERPSRVFEAALANNISIIRDDISLEVYRSDGSKADAEMLEDMINSTVEVEDKADHSGQTVGQVVTDRLNNYIKDRHPELMNDTDTMEPLLLFMNLMVCNLEASNDWNDVTAYSEYEQLEGHLHWSWHRYGYKTFFDIMLNKYNNGPGLPHLDLKLNTEVTNISWSQDPDADVEVTCKDGTIYKTDNVIFTGSVGVLKERHESLFTPPLPQEKIDAIQTVPMGVLDKIILSFEEPWWPHERTFFGFLWRGEDLRAVPEEDRWTTRVYSASRPMGNSNALTFWVNGETAKQLEVMEEGVVKSKLMGLLRRFMGKTYTIPEPNGMIRSGWYTNPFTRGSYTYDSPEVERHPMSRRTLGEPLVDAAGKPRVLFAGEATNPKHYSTVHGASETGYREAMRLLPTSKI